MGSTCKTHGAAVIYGRAYRKLTSQTFAFVAFRWFAIWWLVAACASRGETGEVVALAIIAGDIMASGIGRTIQIYTVAEMGRKDWLDRLTDRVIGQAYWDYRNAVRAPSSEDIEHEARQKALANIKTLDDPDPIDSSLDSKAWHWFGGALNFFGLIFGYLLYFGSALTIGAAMLRSH
jgi:hypothetical protein